jgi:streptogramin lyase
MLPLPVPILSAVPVIPIFSRIAIMKVLNTVLCALSGALVTLAERPATGQKADDEKLYVAKPFTADKSFTPGIEGPACDREGNVYAVNFAKQQTIGKVTPDGKGDVWVTLPGKSTGNGIVFDKSGLMYIADYVAHNVLRIDPATRKIDVFAHNAKMNQPNDLAIAAAIPTGATTPARSGASIRKAPPSWSPTRWARPTASRSAPTARRSTSTSRCSATSGRSLSRPMGRWDRNGS